MSRARGRACVAACWLPAFLAAVLAAPQLAAAPASARHLKPVPARRVSAGSVARPVVLLDKPVRVVARPRPMDATGSTHGFDLDVIHGRERYALETVVLTENADHAIDVVRRTTGWKRGYLFLRSDCGGGNAWKCSNETVFALRHGRLVALGTLAAGDDHAFGGCLGDSVFHDFDGDFEITDLTSHAGAPAFAVTLRERDGRLVGDPDRTWAENAATFASNDSVARANTQPDGRQWEMVLSPRFENAVIAKYCGRDRELAATLTEARRVLPAGILARLEAELAKVVPGALPRTSRPPKLRVAR